MIFFALLAEANPQEREKAERLYARYGNKIYGLAFKYLKNKHDADDILGEVLLKILENAENFGDFDSTKTASLIVIYTRSAVIDFCRKRKHRFRREEPLRFENEEGEEFEIELAAEENTEEAVLAAERANDIRAALDALPPRQLDAIKLIYAMGYSYKEAAKIMGITESAVASLIRRGKENLKKIMGDKLYEYLG